VRLTALVKSAEHVCCRYRLAALRPFLARAGHTLDLVPLPRRWWSRWALFRRLSGANVILQRYLLPPWQLALLRRHAGRLLFDFDDAVFHRDSYSPRGIHDDRRRSRFTATVRACDAVVAGNVYLAEEAVRAGARRVHVIPTCVDPSHYTPRLAGSGDGRTLVWIGSSSTLRGVEADAALLGDLARHVPGLRLKVICDRFPRLPDLPVLPCPWSEATEAGDLEQSAIGISSIPDDPWSRGKCGLKVLQYMAAGLPVVANPVGVQTEMVRHGQTGFLAATREQWRQAIRDLVSDADLRHRMGTAGRRRVETRYHLDASVGPWLDLLARLEHPLTRVS
jgi:glycosyltransferase involved in cell wall biosynthesis